MSYKLYESIRPSPTWGNYASAGKDPSWRKRPWDYQRRTRDTNVCYKSGQWTQTTPENQKKCRTRMCVFFQISFLSTDNFIKPKEMSQKDVLFSLQWKHFLQKLEARPGIKTGDRYINNRRHSSDGRQSKKTCKICLDIVERESSIKGLEVNSKKPEVMAASRKEKPPAPCMHAVSQSVSGSTEYRWKQGLSSSIRVRLLHRKEGALRKLLQAIFSKLNEILTNKHLSLTTRENTLQYYESNLSLRTVCEASTIN